MPEELEKFINDMTRLKENLANIIALSAMGTIGVTEQFDTSNFNSSPEPNNYPLITTAISNSGDFDEKIFINLYNIAIETMLLVHNIVILLCKSDPEKFRQAIKSLNDIYK